MTKATFGNTYLYRKKNYSLVCLGILKINKCYEKTIDDGDGVFIKSVNYKSAGLSI